MSSAAYLHAPVGVILLDLASDGVVDVNHAFAALLGYRREEVVALGLRVLTHPDDLDAAPGALARLGAGELSVSFTKRYLHADGQMVWTDCHVAGLPSLDGRPDLVVAIVTDASNRRRDDVRKRAYAGRAAAVTEIYQALVGNDDMDSPTLLETMTRAISDHVGDYCALLVVGHGGTDLQLVSAQGRDRQFAFDAAAVMASRPPTVEDASMMGEALRSLTPQLQVADAMASIGGIPDEFAELKVRWNVHSNIWIPLHLGQRVVGLLCVCRYGDSPHLDRDDLDLLVAVSGQTTLAVENLSLTAERRRAGAALLASERRFRVAFDDAPIGMALVGLDGRMDRVNRSLCDLLGYDPDELLGASFETFLPQEDVDADTRLLLDLASGRILHYELDRRVARRDGSEVWLSVTVGAIRDATGEVTHLIAQGIDVTDRRRAEAEVERQRGDAELTARLSETLAAVGLDRTAVLDTVVAVCKEFGDYCILLLHDPTDDQLHLAAVHHVHPDGGRLIRQFGRDQGFCAGNSLTAIPFTTGEPVIVPVVDADRLRSQLTPESYAALEQFGGLASVVCLPLRVQGTIIGTMSVGRHLEGHPFEPRDVALLEDIAGRCAVAVANAGLHADVNAAHDRLMVDMAARQAAEAGQRASEERFRRVFDNSPLGMALMDEDFVYQRVNPAFSAITGYPADELVGRTFADITHPDDVEPGDRLGDQVRAGQRDGFSFEKRYIRKQGRVVWVRLTIGILQDDRTGDRTFIATIEDITDRKKATEQLAHLALHDSLTGLPNRVLLRDRLGMRLAELERNNFRQLAVLYVDLDRFKDINDSLGHDVGDSVLVAIAARLQATIRPVDTAARVGGDEFVVVCGGLTSPREAIVLAERIEQAVSAPLQIGDHVLHPSASVGVVTTDKSETADELIRRADTAMYQAKNRGRNRHELFDESLAASVSDRYRAAERIRSAMDENRFRLHYQPIIELATGKVVGAEALLRLQDPVRGILLPCDFLDAAEDSGLIVPLGEWVLREACRQLTEWQRTVAQPLRLAVNISGRQINQIDIRRLVLDAVAESGVDPSGLTLEMTESVLLEAAGNAVENLGALKELGITLAIDDFGTGYSSLSYLKRFPVDIVKIDRTFTTGVGIDRDDTAIVGVIISLGQQMELTVVAEGVETEAQAAHLRRLGCHLAQGWLYSPAIPPADFVAFLR